MINFYYPTLCWNRSLLFRFLSILCFTFVTAQFNSVNAQAAGGTKRTVKNGRVDSAALVPINPDQVVIGSGGDGGGGGGASGGGLGGCTIAIVSNPSSVTNCEYSQSSFTAASNSSNATVTVQWQFSADNGSTWTAIDAADAFPFYTNYTTTTLQITSTPLLNGYQYRAVFTVGTCTATSNAATLTLVSQSQYANAGTISGTTPLCIGPTTTAFKSTGTLGGTWSSSTPLVASVDASGFVTALNAGNATISYTVTGCNGTAVATIAIVVNPNVTSGTISGITSFCIGSGQTLNSNGTLGGTWSSNAPGIATVDQGGKVTAVSEGNATISYTVTGCNGPAVATIAIVVSRPVIAPGTISGTTSLCINAGTFLDTAIPGGTWSTSAPGVVAVVPITGEIAAVSAGNATISYTVTGCNGTATSTIAIVVNPNAAITSVSGTSPLCIGTKTAYIASGVVLGGGTGAWSSSNTVVATVDASGSVTTVSAGTANIIYTITGGCNGTPSAQQAITVSPNVTAGTISGTTPLCIGPTTAFKSTGTIGGTWSSSTPLVASVDASGFVTAVSEGNATISYTVTGCNGPVTSTIAIVVSPNAAITSVSGTSPLCIVTTTPYTASGVVLGGGTGAWSSSNKTVATVDASGSVTTVSAGTANIIYTITGGCNGTPSAQQLVTVTANAAITSVSGTSPLCIVTTTPYTASGVVLGGGTGAWSSSNKTVATVDASGSVTTVSAGTANIIYTITGGCNGTQSAQQAITVTANAAISSVSGTSPLCIGATATYTASGVVLSGGTGAWSSSNTTVATVDASGSVTTVSAGTANIIYTITGGCNGTPSAQQAITVSPNAICAAYNGDYFANTASTTTGGSAVVTLIYNISADQSGACKDISNLTIADLSLSSVKDNTITSVLPIGPGSYSGGVYTIQYTITLASNAYSGTVQFLLHVSSNFTINPTCSNDPLVTVSTKVPGIVTGGGFIIPVNSGGTIGGTPVNGLRNNFGFNIKFNNNKLQGNWNTIIRRMENGVVINYQVKSNVPASLVITKITNTSYRADMSFTSANFQNLTCPLCPVNANNGTVLVSVYDNGQPGAGIDRILITIKDHSGSVWYTSDNTQNNSVSSTNLQLLNQGNIQIRTSGGAFAYSASTSISQQQAPSLSVSAYPNPFTDKVIFSIESPVSGKASLDIYNVLGQKLHTIYQGYLFAGRGQVVEYNAPGVYKGALIYTLRVGDKQVNGKLIQVK
jgi:uncharacterized protein YjdB